MKKLNLDAVALLGRANLPKPGNSPFSPIASGICIHPDGVVATCCHAIEGFLQRWSPHVIPTGPNVEEAIEDAELNERPYFFFPSSFAWQQSTEAHEGIVYPMLSSQGDRLQDVAVVELGGSGADRPLPFVPIATQPPKIGDTVCYAGFYQGHDMLLDPEGNLLRWQVTRETVTVAACQPTGFLIDYPVRPGMSGSGVCDYNGALLGIICEHWPPALAAERVSIEKPLGLVAYAHWLIPQYQVLRSKAADRAAVGELPWCGLA